jgi:hypothetical protein
MERTPLGGRISPLFLATALLLGLGAVHQPAFGQQTLLTRYTEIRAAAAADLLRMERRLTFPAAKPAPPPVTIGKFAYHPGFARLSAKIDGIYERAASLLHISGVRPPRVTLVLLPDGKEVRRQHVQMVPGQRAGLFGYGTLEAFYAVGPKTIYLSLADLREGILAHELAHHLLCTVAGAPPPEQTQEAYAHFVEAHL